MKRLVLKRFVSNADGTFGRMWLEGNPSTWWFTMEKPWMDNKPSISCIPPGEYKLRHGTFAHGGGYPDLEFVEVDGRENIEIHAANFPKELKGCIAPGKGMSTTGWAISESRKALAEILEAINGDPQMEIVIYESSFA